MKPSVKCLLIEYNDSADKKSQQKEKKARVTKRRAKMNANVCTFLAVCHTPSAKILCQINICSFLSHFWICERLRANTHSHTSKHLSMIECYFISKCYFQHWFNAKCDPNAVLLQIVKDTHKFVVVVDGLCNILNVQVARLPIIVAHCFIAHIQYAIWVSLLRVLFSRFSPMKKKKLYDYWKTFQQLINHFGSEGSLHDEYDELTNKTYYCIDWYGMQYTRGVLLFIVYLSVRFGIQLHTFYFVLFWFDFALAQYSKQVH